MEDFLEKIIGFLCVKCGEVSYRPAKMYHHNEGLLNHYLKTPIQLDFDDTKEGFFNRICSCYMAFILTDGNITESLLSEIILCNSSSTLVEKCTNIEKTLAKELTEDINSHVKEKILNFYKYVRPSLLYFYKNRNNIFLRHGFELIDSIKYDGCFPPELSFRSSIDVQSYKIETDRVPFGYERFDRVEQHGYCSNHGLGLPFNLLKGYISLEDFDSNGGKILYDKHFKHEICAKSNIDISKWHFLYQKIDENNKHVKDMLKRGIPIIDQKIVLKFFILVKLLRDRITVINIK